MRSWFLAVPLLALAVSCSSRTEEFRSGAQSQAQTASQAQTVAAAAEPSPADDGRQIYLENCVSCHGRNADGNTSAGRVWKVPDLRSPEVQSKSDKQLLQIVRAGKGKMPPWNGLLSAKDMEHVLAYIRTFRKP